MSISRNWLYAIGTFIIAFILGFSLVIPILTGKSGLEILQEFLEGDIDKNIADVGEEPLVGEAYHYWYAPENSFGVSSTKTVNWSYFQNWSMNALDVTLYYKSGGDWIDCSDYLNVTWIWNETYYKSVINFTTPVEAKYRLQYDFDKSVVSYVNKTDKDVYWLNYSANATEIYNCFFNWSDVDKNDWNVKSKLKVNQNKEYFYCEIDSKGKLDAGTVFEFDPTFGWTGATGTSSTTIEDKIQGAYAQMGAETGQQADNITVYITVSLASKNMKAALYDSSKNIVTNGVTGEISVPGDGGKDRLFTFSDPKPNLVADAWYYICVWSELSVGVAETERYYEYGDGLYYDDEVYDGFPGTFAGDTIDADARTRFYCSYSEGVPANNPPTQTGEVPANGSTSVDVSGGVPDLYVICNDADGGDTLTATWSSNSSGSWYDFATNSSISPATNITQTNVNFSTELTTYYWKINLTDATDWNNETYHFTTVANATWQIVDDTINGSIYNISHWYVIDNAINGSIYNISRWNIFDSTINGSIYNVSRWNVIDNTINGSIYNVSRWNIIDSTVNGSIYNLTTWKTIDNTINGSIYNISYWYIIDNNINGSIYNLTSWNIIDDTINGSIYNLTLWKTIDNSINGSIYNVSVSHWYVIDSTINGSIYNITVVNITISNPYPADESVNIPVNVTLHITINHTIGYTMNLTWYTGNSTANCTHYLGSHLNVNNGTYYIGYHNASEVSTEYAWKVNVTDGHGNYVEEVYNFTTASTTGEIYVIGGIGGYGMGMVIAFSLAFALLFSPFIALLWKRKRKREE